MGTLKGKCAGGVRGQAKPFARVHYPTRKWDTAGKISLTKELKERAS